ncbi:MAG: hypothetical protein QOJ73_6622 [Streptosporangiaceae bacterium]|jgi:hypothetical protein|nr:hypothetical protein [Streptosporangiaceae bacterium]
MSALIKGFCLLVGFFLELAVLGSAGYWGFTVSPDLAVRLLAGLGVPVLLAMAWGVFAAPRAARPLRGAPRAAFEVAWFGAGVVLLAAAGAGIVAAMLALDYLANTMLLRLWLRR